MRRAVLEQRTAFVEERFRDALRTDGAPPRCDRTGVTLHEPGACLVAYEKPGAFAALRYDWLVNEGISATEVRIDIPKEVSGLYDCHCIFISMIPRCFLMTYCGWREEWEAISSNDLEDCLFPAQVFVPGFDQVSEHAACKPIPAYSCTKTG